MRLVLANRALPAAPKGKRRVHSNRWGNTNAYIGGKFWRTIGPTYSAGVEAEADAFLRGEID